MASGKNMIKSRGTGETVYGPAGAKNPLSEEDVAAIAMFPQTITAFLAKVAELERRNKALERAIKANDASVCETCIYHDAARPECIDGICSRENDLWQFDIARFVGEEESR